VAEAVLIGPGGKDVREYLYVDSGADHTLIPFHLGRYLGLSGGEVHEVRGISGIVGVVYATMKIDLAGFIFPTRVAWAQIEAVPLLLGRADVFDRFEITFIQSRLTVVFRAVD